MLNKTNLYFAYGMNTPKSRFTLPQWVGPAILEGYKLEFHTHAHVEPSSKCIVHGSLWRIDDQDLESLDRQEGYPTYYDRKIVKVSQGWSPNSSKVDAITYFMTPDGNKMMTHNPPSQGYSATIRRGYLDAGHDAKFLDRWLEANHRARQNNKRDLDFYQYSEPDFDESVIDADSLWPQGW